MSARRTRSGAASVAAALQSANINRIARSYRIRARCRDLARAMDAARLAGLAVGGSRARDDRVRLPHIAMVSTLAAG